mmetsp:Transcript_2123/g.8449  ORF Transcript_2123/g.8449 Transcript_2123/m.8449 type:complete len:259 (-) Transcript_2123:617-1393(-)
MSPPTWTPPNTSRGTRSTRPALPTSCASSGSTSIAMRSGCATALTQRDWPKSSRRAIPKRRSVRRRCAWRQRAASSMWAWRLVAVAEARMMAPAAAPSSRKRRSRLPRRGHQRVWSTICHAAPSSCAAWTARRASPSTRARRCSTQLSRRTPPKNASTWRSCTCGAFTASTTTVVRSPRDSSAPRPSRATCVVRRTAQPWRRSPVTRTRQPPPRPHSASGRPPSMRHGRRASPRATQPRRSSAQKRWKQRSKPGSKTR